MRASLRLTPLLVILFATLAHAQFTIVEVSDLTATTGATAERVDIVLDSSNGSDLDGWSFGVCHDSEIVELTTAMGVDSVVTIGEFAANGIPSTLTASFETATVVPGAGFTTAATLGMPTATLPPSSNVLITVAFYDIIGTAGETTELELCSVVGSNVIPVQITSPTGNSLPVTLDGEVLVSAGDELFVRGECNQDGFIDLSDGTTLLRVLGGVLLAPDCLDACDFNGDGGVSLLDAVNFFQHIFLGGAPLAAPYPSCDTAPVVVGNSCTFDPMVCP